MPKPLSSSQQKAVQALVAKGDLEGAKKIIDAAVEDEKKAAAEPEKPKEPRTVNEVLLDFAKAVHSLLGNSPALVPLIGELEDLVTPIETEDPPLPS
jgi:polyhydroxyalkanoate synthesis regulator phasin